MAHDHARGRSDDSPRSFSAAFAAGILLNLAFVIIEVIYGVRSHSMALVTDAAHNLGDVLGLGLSWGAAVLAVAKPTKRRTYGFRRATILSSWVNAVVLLSVTGAIAWESLQRLLAPEPVQGKVVIVVALIGVVINASSAALFLAGRKGDLNVRSAFLHLASDAALALGVAVAGVVMLLTGWRWVDPVVSIALSAVILASTWSLMKNSMNLVLDAVPEGIDPERVKAYLGTLDGVSEVHDLHIWAMSTTETALTAHLVMPGGSCSPRFLHHAGDELRARFRIDHATLQIEAIDAPDPCRLAPEDTI